MPPPDIFISYARADEDIARRYARAFSQAGLKVWWDEDLRSGEVFDQAIEAALRAAKAVVVLWSPSSANSRWVRAEATLADRKKTMVPVTIEQCERPIIFELTHTIDLSHWQGDDSDLAWQEFARHVRDFVGKGGAAKPDAATPAPAPKRTLPSKPSIAVLPFLNLSGDLEQEYFADGVVDDIISALSRFNQIFVIARSSSFTYKGRQVDYRTVADELGVRFVLEGSIRKAGNRVRIGGQLVDAQTGAHLWTDKFDGAIEDVFDLQDRITEQVVGAIEPSIQRAEILRARSKPADNLDAYDLYLQALPPLWNFTPEGNASARELLEKALAIDPDYPQALAAVAWAYDQARWFGDPAQAAESKAKAVEYARRGLATGSDDAYVLAVCGWAVLIAGHDVRAAMDAKERALHRNPNSPWVTINCSHIETFTGNPQAGLELAERAIRQNPLDPHKFLYLSALAFALQWLERWEEEAAVVDSFLNDAPNWLPGLTQGVIATAHIGDLDKARELGDRILAIDPELTISNFLSELPPLTPTMEAAYRKGLAMAGIPE